MLIDLIKLKNNIEEYIYIDELYTFSKDHLEKTEILKLDNVKIKGYLTKNAMDDIELDINIEGTMILPCSVTLKPVEHKFKTKINGNLYELMEEIEENDKKMENTIDILPIIWENILMEIPMKVTSKDISGAKTKGKGWKLVTKEEENINPELQKLKDLL